MDEGFELRVIKQYWLGSGSDEADLCSHGLIYLRVRDVVVSDENDRDWGISESALALLRSVRYGHPYEQRGSIGERCLVYHGCGTMLMQSCPISITWNVELDQDRVVLSGFRKRPTTNEKEAIEYPGLRAALRLSGYAQQVYAFALDAKGLFEGVQKRIRDSELWEGEYEGFWREYEELLAYAGSVLSAKE